MATYGEQVIYRYLDCGNLHNGFALLKTLVTTGNLQCSSLIHAEDL
jgi:hypothetical protein